MSAAAHDHDQGRIVALSEALRRVRQVDSDCSEAAVAQYVREIDEMAAILAPVRPAELFEPEPFDAAWRNGAGR